MSGEMWSQKPGGLSQEVVFIAGTTVPEKLIIGLEEFSKSLIDHAINTCCQSAMLHVTVTRHQDRLKDSRQDGHSSPNGSAVVID